MNSTQSAGESKPTNGFIARSNSSSTPVDSNSSRTCAWYPHRAGGVPGRLRQPRPDRLEDLPDVALRRPVDQADRAAVPGDTRRLLRRGLVAGGELDAEGREHHIEAAVLEREVLGVALDPVDLDAGL